MGRWVSSKSSAMGKSMHIPAWSQSIFRFVLVTLFSFVVMNFQPQVSSIVNFLLSSNSIELMTIQLKLNISIVIFHHKKYKYIFIYIFLQWNWMEIGHKCRQIKSFWSFTGKWKDHKLGMRTLIAQYKQKNYGVSSFIAYIFSKQ